MMCFRFSKAVVTWPAKRSAAGERGPLVAAELLDGEVQPDEVPPEAHSLVYLDRRWHRLHKELDGVAELLESSRFL